MPFTRSKYELKAYREICSLCKGKGYNFLSADQMDNKVVSKQHPELSSICNEYISRKFWGHDGHHSILQPESCVAKCET